MELRSSKLKRRKERGADFVDSALHRELESVLLSVFPIFFSSLYNPVIMSGAGTAKLPTGGRKGGKGG